MLTIGWLLFYGTVGGKEKILISIYSSSVQYERCSFSVWVRESFQKEGLLTSWRILEFRCVLLLGLPRDCDVFTPSGKYYRLRDLNIYYELKYITCDCLTTVLLDWLWLWEILSWLSNVLFIVSFFSKNNGEKNIINFKLIALEYWFPWTYWGNISRGFGAVEGL